MIFIKLRAYSSRLVAANDNNSNINSFPPPPPPFIRFFSIFVCTLIRPQRQHQAPNPSQVQQDK